MGSKLDAFLLSAFPYSTSKVNDNSGYKSEDGKVYNPVKERVYVCK